VLAELFSIVDLRVPLSVALLYIYIYIYIYVYVCIYMCVFRSTSMPVKEIQSAQHALGRFSCERVYFVHSARD
jgi:hypothetical protein